MISDLALLIICCQTNPPNIYNSKLVCCHVKGQIQLNCIDLYLGFHESTVLKKNLSLLFLFFAFKGSIFLRIYLFPQLVLNLSPLVATFVIC